MASLSAQRRLEILDALRRGTVPRRGLDALAVGLSRFETVMDETLTHVAAGQSGFKAVRGDYGCGKTFFARWIQERAKQKGFAVAEVQISETETPLHRLETVYRRLIEHLSTSTAESGAFRSVVDGWFYTLEEDAIAAGADASDANALFAAADELMEKRLEAVSRTSATFAAVLRAYRRTIQSGDVGTADGLLAWLGGQPNVAASVKRAAQIKGDVDHFTALNFLQGLLVMLRDSGHAGLVLVFLAYGGLYWFGWGVLIASALYVIDNIFFSLAIALKTYFQKIADPADIAPTAAVAFTINHIAAVFLPASLGYLWLISPSAVFLLAAGMALTSLALSFLIPRHPEPGHETIFSRMRGVGVT